MNHKHGLVVFVTVLVVALLLSAGGAIAQGEGPQSVDAAPGTAITYQGQLKNASGPVNGNCDFQFGLWDSLSNATGQVGATLTKPNVTLTYGLFTVTLDFGAGAFTGDARWLQIAVSCPAGGSYITLAPRQPLTPAPYALALPGLWTQQNTTSPNVVGGYRGNVIGASAVGATVSGGGDAANLNTASANYATVGGGHGNTAGGTFATAGGGGGNKASANDSTVAGGILNQATGFRSAIGGGTTNSASGQAATVPGGEGNVAAGDDSLAAGNHAKASHYAEMAYAAGNFSHEGDAQTSVYVLRKETTDGAHQELYLDGSGARLTIPTNRAMTFDILVVGRSNTNLAAGYAMRGVIENHGGTTRLVGTPNITALAEDNAAWDATVQADDAHDALLIVVTGIQGMDVRWVATVRTTEVAW